MAKNHIEADEIGEEIGLTREETPFYHILTSPELVKDMYKDETLIEMARELIWN